MDRYGSRTSSDVYSAKAVAVLTAAITVAAVAGFWATFDLFKGIYASVYLAVCALWYLLLQTKLRCVNCRYFDRTCGRGLGRIASLLFRADSGSELWGARLARVFWPYWFFVVPTLGIIYILVFHFTWLELIYGAVFGVAAVSAFIVDWRVWRGPDGCYRPMSHPDVAR